MKKANRLLYVGTSYAIRRLALDYVVRWNKTGPLRRNLAITAMIALSDWCDFSYANGLSKRAAKYAFRPDLIIR
ncbi:hypothetical protein J4727_04625 [Providencia rettgeri]|uniref:Uncharacterized protein n=1 Tax=Providencia rettgeri TaxID=587 RepID=A0A939NAV8_PRORE|nr:hypothetical protein [Providencia rettgeri]